MPRTETLPETLIVRPLALGLTWEKKRLISIGLGWAEGREQTKDLSMLAQELRKNLAQYLNAEPMSWPALPLAWNRLAPFSRRVLSKLAKEVPPGQTISYGGLAALAGSPGAARAVGQIMARNPWPLVIPCHRVIGTNGKLTGFGPGLAMKKYLLRLEGCPGF
ncbi:MAG: MGMT family protein [Thermodesulfobacteriota bacterium]|nr:MGMT family protein [Thermodesulfobacteriota bacterium]